MRKLFVVLFAGLAGMHLAGAGVWPEPMKESRPWAYNWWMGSAVDEAGLRLQVEEMAKVGMGGFHVIPIYSVRDNPNDKVLLSPEWMRAFGDAVRLAKEQGMGVDLTTGSGWCFGGPQLKPEQGCWKLEVKEKVKVIGEGEQRKISSAVQPSTSNLPPVLWRGEKDGKEIVLSVRPTGQQVKRSGPGGHGPMMNPFSASAMKDFLTPFSAAFDAPNAPKPEHMYHDSYEYYGANWSAELPETFAKRRGYRLEDHYAELAGVGDPDAIARVKCDYRETLSEMLVEDVFSQWTDWCKARGIGTRNEAHGAPANLLDFYALADIPETEMFSCDKKRAQEPTVTSRFMNSGDRDILVSKFASSAAHVKHLGAAADPLVAAESCTWVCEHFCETLGAVKTFVDRLFLSGVNHMFYHGMCYSPADAKWPGWTFYATCEMNRFNPIWRDADILNRYVTRVQSVAQSEAIDNDILVYWPLHDFWMDASGFEKQMTVEGFDPKNTVHARSWLGGQPVGKIARRLMDDGYAFDFISEKQLDALARRTRAAEDVGPYRAIIVPGAKAMKPETFARFVELADAGYAVLFVDGFPTTVPGWKDVAKREAELKRLIANASGKVRCGAYDELMAAAPVRREPFNRAAGLAFTRHAGDGVVTYFIANQYRDEGVKGCFKPGSPCKSAELWDPMAGEIRETEVRDGQVELDLPIGQSVLLKVYAKEKMKVRGEGEQWNASSSQTVQTSQTFLANTWTRTPVAGGPDFPSVVKGALPLPWGKTKDYPENAFCGTMRYETTFEKVDGESRWTKEELLLDLGKVEQSAKVFVNGRYAGGAIMPPYRLTIPAELVKSGTNTLAVEVTSTGANRLKWLDAAKPYPWKIFTDINMVNINYKPLDASKWKQREYGLFGPVTLTTRIAAARDPYRADESSVGSARRADRETLQSKIDAAAAAGGGRVDVPAGEHLLKGPIHLRSNVELHLDDGARLVFEDDPKLYLPTVMSSWEGVECKTLSPLIYAYGCTNVAITGGGTFAPKMKFWRTWFGRPPSHLAATRQLYDWCSFQNVPPEKRDVTALEDSRVRPHLMQFNRCKNVRLDGFRIRESPFWTIHLFMSDDCVVRNLDVYAHGHNNDGVDVEMSRDVLIENCVFDQGDDAIVIKSGRNRDAWRIGRPSENVEIRNCTVRNGHVLLGIGSEMSGGVRNVWMHDCTLESSCNNLFYCKTNERRGGFIENIRMENVRAKNVRDAVLGVETDVLYQWKKFPTHEVRVTPVSGLSMKNVEVESAGWLVRIRGDEREPVRGVKLENVHCRRVKHPNVLENAADVSLGNLVE